ncbi:UDP-3-O-(3-hydroxymyristoyl)glucosamine N-acyltransferase [Candidatus Atelocyanobacterium thalassae]|jgi:UDP-3-O-[3-hydroxymyristoyl] glucosamine N-acyltransferase|uniref:UDP-3-O-acylglucosamine N-acyltransferase n=1 Tax=Atelocyanobacterium thalassa (isolate ALOHA) TaxID=1453429 RepID=D3ENU6_ATETH|nr:UDP-3-O-(3-hydroxymyristoyl)glucosamine N-acyltransferase [Candidatus Atelocyanobacterium thalassa]ADB95146.1 UDP-3-O-(3-hydroxymyristoyl) glucosamine N-acyltransferase [Candidatus Atelocyanobacterium thalassa isolate ALOHA]MCH2543156.1 UDP-3-O-(3-hydroxymyristoyl)glucosamine N-acyltransferase [Candidatus Atelocyanobacterium sp. ALOHA_A2.5_9]|tara:strand:+ start:9414 stop:10448 length:1035 start_codon:yes stop_codon:yes gene_type:complete
MKFEKIVNKLDFLSNGNSLVDNKKCELEITGVSSITEAKTGHLSYIEGPKFASMISKTSASALILPPDKKLQEEATERGILWLTTSETRLAFAHAIKLFYQPFRPAPGIDSTSIIHPSVKIGENVFIGPHTIIQQDSVIEDEVCIQGNVVIYPEVIIGNNTLLHANCTIHERTQIGNNCVIHSGAVIGAEGFGFVPIAEGWFKMEQSGFVSLGNNVEIGCNSAIDRPAVGTTRIENNTKIDNLVHVAHNCNIGESCAFAAQVGLAGGVKVGKRVILAGQVGVANQVSIGDGAIATAQTGIASNINSGEVVSSSPAIDNKLYLKASAIYKRLPEMYKILRNLQKK